MKVNFITGHVDKKLIYILKQFLDFSLLDIELVVQRPPQADAPGSKSIYYLDDFQRVAQAQGIFIYSGGNYEITSLKGINHNYKGRNFFVWEGFSGGGPPIKNAAERTEVNFDLFGQAFYQLSGYQEYILEASGKRLRSKAGNISADSAVFNAPNVNILFLILESLIAETFGIGQVSQERYPQGKKFAVVLTHDLDALKKTPKDRVKHIWHGLNRAMRLAQSRKFSAAAGEILKAVSKFIRRAQYNNIDYLSRLEEKNGVSSSLNVYVRSKKNKSGLANWFYNPEYDVARDTALAKQLKDFAKKHFTVGIHGSYSSGRRHSLLQEELSLLEGILQEKIEGGRQHFLDYSVFRTPGVFQDTAIKYDTSVGFRDLNGFRAGACLPYYLYSLPDDQATGVLEIPLVIMDGVLFDRQDGTKESAWQSAQAILEKIKAAQGCASIVWHQRVFKNRDYPYWEEVYSMLINWVKNNQGALLSPSELHRFWRSKKTDRLILATG